jgi:hypothetical protein
MTPPFYLLFPQISSAQTNKQTSSSSCLILKKNNSHGFGQRAVTTHTHSISFPNPCLENVASPRIDHCDLRVPAQTARIEIGSAGEKRIVMRLQIFSFIIIPWALFSLPISLGPRKSYCRPTKPNCCLILTFLDPNRIMHVAETPSNQLSLGTWTNKVP